MRVVVAWLVVCSLAGVASAQAPGETAPGAAPPAAAGPVAPPTVMSARWAVALSLSPESLTPQNEMSATHVNFTTLELAGRYRIRPWIEAGVTLIAGGASAETDISQGGFYVDGRWRIAPERAWNGIVDVGIGAIEVASPDAINIDRKARGSFRIGGGVERRFGDLGLSASVFLVAIAKNPDSTDSGPNATANQFARDGLGGATFTVCAAYYF